MTKHIASISRTREILKEFNLFAKKGFGQNFLTDASVVVRCAEMSHCENAVIEIGPGIGSLTQQLALRSKHVYCFEVDPRLPEVLSETLQEYDNVEIVLQDILTADLEEVVKRLKAEYGEVVVCANLPYYITTPILFRLFECIPAIPYITVMVQKEVADRFAAGVNDKEYGALSVESQYLYDVKKLFQVSRNCFQPAPNVDSAIIQFKRKEIERPVDNQDDFFRLIKAAFQQRRKTLYNNLKEYLGDGERVLCLLEKTGIDPKCRAQELDVAAFQKLYEGLKEC